MSATGLALALCGEALRKAAILTARRNFTHVIAFEKRQSHQLIVSGVRVRPSSVSCMQTRSDGCSRAKMLCV